MSEGKNVHRRREILLLFTEIRKSSDFSSPAFLNYFFFLLASMLRTWARTTDALGKVLGPLEALLSFAPDGSQLQQTGTLIKLGHYALLKAPYIATYAFSRRDLLGTAVLITAETAKLTLSIGTLGDLIPLYRKVYDAYN